MLRFQGRAERAPSESLAITRQYARQNSPWKGPLFLRPPGSERSILGFVPSGGALVRAFGLQTWSLGPFRHRAVGILWLGIHGIQAFHNGHILEKSATKSAFDSPKVTNSVSHAAASWCSDAALSSAAPPYGAAPKKGGDLSRRGKTAAPGRKWWHGNGIGMAECPNLFQLIVELWLFLIPYFASWHPE